MAIITVRVDPNTEALVERLARRRGQTKSQVVRDALRQLVEREDGAPRGGSAYHKLKNLIGCWDSGGLNLSQKTGEKFAELLRQKQKQKQKKERARRSS